MSDRMAEHLIREAERFAAEAIAKNPAMQITYLDRLASYKALMSGEKKDASPPQS